MKDSVKRAMFKGGKVQRRLRGGISRGQVMSVDLQSQLQRYLGLDERELRRVLLRLISFCRTLVDVGANDGYYTTAFLASSAEKIIACEPGSSGTELLANAKANGHSPSERFHLERRLIGSREGEAGLTELLSGCPRPVLIKVDVDGAEMGVIESAEDYTYLLQTFWVVETHSLELEKSSLVWFANHGFRTEIIDNAWWRRVIPELRPIAHNRWIVAWPTQL